MKHCISIVLISILLSACNKTGKALKEKISGADSIAINYFKGDGSMDSVIAVKIIRDAATIQELTGMVSNSSTKQLNTCGFDGSLHFFKMNKVIQDIDFRAGDDCSQFAYSFLGEPYTATLGEAARKLLIEIKGK